MDGVQISATGFLSLPAVEGHESIPSSHRATGRYKDLEGDSVRDRVRGFWVLFWGRIQGHGISNRGLGK